MTPREVIFCILKILFTEICNFGKHVIKLFAAAWRRTSCFHLLVLLHSLEELLDILLPHNLLAVGELGQVLHEVVLHGIVRVDCLHLKLKFHIALYLFKIYYVPVELSPFDPALPYQLLQLMRRHLGILLPGSISFLKISYPPISYFSTRVIFCLQTVFVRYFNTSSCQTLRSNDKTILNVAIGKNKPFLRSDGQCLSHL